MQFQIRNIARAALLALLLCLGAAGVAQIPGLPSLNGTPAEDASPKVLNWASAPVEVDGRVLFRRYAADPQSARLRAEVASLRLQGIVNEIGDRPLPDIEVNPDGEPPVEIAVAGETLLTITEADTQATGTEAQRLAEMWANEIRRAFAAAYEEQQPEFLRDAALRASVWLIAGLALYLTLITLRRRWLDHTSWPTFVLLWGFILGRILTLFPQTRPLYNIVVHGTFRPLTIVVVTLLIAVALSRAWSSVLRNAFPMDPEELSLEERTERAYRRRTTLAAVARITGVTIIWIVAFFSGLTWLGVNLPALIASAGLIGVALGLAAQDSMKDIVAGVNILVDDRYGVDDVISVNGHCGRVERLNLRITQIRDLSGQLITIPNRTVEAVVNQTSRWAQVDLKVGVAYGANLRQAMDKMVEAALSLRADWPDQVIEDPMMLGVDSFDDCCITLRMLLRTAPGEQWAVGRELRLRIKDLFDAANIEIPFPQHDIWIRSEGTQVAEQ